MKKILVENLKYHDMIHHCKDKNCLFTKINSNLIKNNRIRVIVHFFFIIIIAQNSKFSVTEIGRLFVRNY